MNGETFMLGGRAFAPIKNGTMKRDLAMIGIEEAAGLLPDVEPLPGEDARAFAERMVLIVTRSGKFCDLLGGLMIPAELDPKAWTPEIGAQTAAHIEMVDDPAEKEILRGLAASLLASFFVKGRPFSKTFPMSS